MSEAVENKRPLLSVIIPTLNEEGSIGLTLKALARMRGNVEVIVADGDSNDSTTEIARRFGARVVPSDRGRGIQMHSGARVARGEMLLFLHADTLIPLDAAEQITEALTSDAATVGGNFGIRFDGERRAARLMTWLYPKLGKLGLYYGDSGIFVRASVYKQIGGFKEFPIFEDLDFVHRLKRRGSLVHLPVAVITSSRRFEGRSFLFTFARWSILQGLYWLGVSPRLLCKLYAPVRTANVRNR
jgi:rSAM/selenodomain-associated transferase 2